MQLKYRLTLALVAIKLLWLVLAALAVFSIACVGHFYFGIPLLISFLASGALMAFVVWCERDDPLGDWKVLRLHWNHYLIHPPAPGTVLFPRRPSAEPARPSRLERPPWPPDQWQL